MKIEMNLTPADLDALTVFELEAAYDAAQTFRTRIWNPELEAYIDMLGEALYNRPYPYDDDGYDDDGYDDAPVAR